MSIASNNMNLNPQPSTEERSRSISFIRGSNIQNEMLKFCVLTQILSINSYVIVSEYNVPHHYLVHQVCFLACRQSKYNGCDALEQEKKLHSNNDKEWQWKARQKWHEIKWAIKWISLWHILWSEFWEMAQFEMKFIADNISRKLWNAADSPLSWHLFEITWTFIQHKP